MPQCLRKVLQAAAPDNITTQSERHLWRIRQTPGVDDFGIHAHRLAAVPVTQMRPFLLPAKVAPLLV
jgi:hypothetical protein